MLSLMQLQGAIKNKKIPAQKLLYPSVNAAIYYVLPFVPAGLPTLTHHKLWPAPPLMETFFGSAAALGKTRVSDLVSCVRGGAMGVMGPSAPPIHRAAIEELIWRTCGKLLNVV